MDSSSQAQMTADAMRKLDIISNYVPLDGIADEMIDPAGNIRPGWSELLAAFESLGRVALDERFDRADQYLSDAGVYYRMFDGTATSERDWPLAHVPLLINHEEWQNLTAGIIQRADLLENVVADIYGAGDLVGRGLIPPALIAASPEFLRPLVGTKPVSGHFLHFCAFDLGRRSDGQWQILGDRTQAPSGAGFALENRVAITRALPEIHSKMNVHRLASFFRNFRDALLRSTNSPDEKVAILTPGPLNETYFEHAYIARYLGISLLEGEDLVVVNGKVMVRTVSGLRPVKMLWRRLDATFADPVELNHNSKLGTPGLVQALRSGSLSLVNALGVGILETRAIGAYLPAISKDLTGSALQLPSLETFWCGEKQHRDHVLANLDNMIVGPAISTLIAFEDQAAAQNGADLSHTDRKNFIANINRHGASYVGQRPASLSTMPVFVDGKLQPRPVTLRVFAARTANGWIVMPGGFARVGDNAETGALNMQRGGKAADVWITSNKPVSQETLLNSATGNEQRNTYGDLPSRAADNLLWMGRYTERNEFLARILRAYNLRLAESGNPDMPLLVDMRTWLLKKSIDPTEAIPAGLLNTIESAVSSAGRIRDRFSPDGWMALRDLQKTMQEFSKKVQSGDDAASAMTILLRKLAGFAGLVHENMYRFSGWRFLEIGRRLERASQLAHLTSAFTKPDAASGALEMLLEVGDSVLTHRRRYNIDSVADTVVELLVLDSLNPRSVTFQLARLKEQIERLPQGTINGQFAPTTKEALRLETSLQVAEAASMTPRELTQLGASVDNLAGLIGLTYHG